MSSSLGLSVYYSFLTASSNSTKCNGLPVDLTILLFPICCSNSVEDFLKMVSIHVCIFSLYSCFCSFLSLNFIESFCARCTACLFFRIFVLSQTVFRLCLLSLSLSTKDEIQLFLAIVTMRCASSLNLLHSPLRNLPLTSFDLDWHSILLLLFVNGAKNSWYRKLSFAIFMLFTFILISWINFALVMLVATKIWSIVNFSF